MVLWFFNKEAWFVLAAMLEGILLPSNTALQAATILVAMATEKKFWRPKFWGKSPIGDQQIKRETYLKNDQLNNRTNLINSTSGSITCLSLFPSRRSETRHECVNLLQQSKVLKMWAENVQFGALALCVLRDEVSSLFTFFLCNMSWGVLPFAFFGFWRLNGFLWRPFCN